MIGKLYIFDLVTDRSIEWLVVRDLQDGESYVQVVPCDDTPLIGCCDVAVCHDRALEGQAKMFARCGVSLWCGMSDLFSHRMTAVGDVSSEELSNVRKRLAEIARGIIPVSTPDDDDLEYIELCGELDKLGLFLSNGKI